MTELSKRDIFALVVAFARLHRADRGSVYSTPEHVARLAYETADEMLKRSDAASSEQEKK